MLRAYLSRDSDTTVRGSAWLSRFFFFLKVLGDLNEQPILRARDPTDVDLCVILLAHTELIHTQPFALNPCRARSSSSCP